jgi:putative peptidoglycan lipid II flippase
MSAAASGEAQSLSQTTAAHSSVRSARRVASGILLSRIAGFVRTSAIASALGTSPWATAFSAALRMPNALQNLLGEGTLSASFIPVYARLLAQGDERAAGRLAGAVFALLLAAAGGFALIGITLAPVLVRIFTPGFAPATRDATIACVRIIFPMTGLLVLSAWAIGILNSHRRFFISYSAPVLWNAAIIAAALLFSGRLQGLDLLLALSWGALAGGALQFLVQLPWVLRLERSLAVRWDTRSAETQQVLRNAGPAILGRGVVQLSAYLDQWLASWLFSGALAALNYAQTLYVLPVSLFGMSVAAAELPEMARQGEQAAVLRQRMEDALQRIALLVMPAVIGYTVLGDLVVGTLLQRGQFLRVDTLLVHAVLLCYAIGLLAATSTRLYSSAFYALNDTRTPARIAALRVALAAALGVLLMLMLERYALRASPFGIVRSAGADATLRPLGAAGLALASGIAAWVEWTLLRRGIRRRIGGLGMGRGLLLRLLFAALVPAVLVRLAMLVALPRYPLFVVGATLLPLFGLGYLLLASLLGVAPARAMLGRVRR